MGFAWAFSRLHEGNSRILLPLLLKPCAFFGKKRRGKFYFDFTSVPNSCMRSVLQKNFGSKTAGKAIFLKKKKIIIM